MRLGEPRWIVPGPGLPAGFDVGRSNNNLDVAEHEGHLWLALRTAPTHYASASARLVVLASADGGRSWTLEHTVAMGRDVREPRLVSWQGRLLLYWFTAGTTGTRFEPDVIWVAERTADGGWRDSQAISPPDCVVWRVRPYGDRLLMTLYRGAGKLFTARPEPLTVELWASDDGIVWAPLDAARPVVHEGGTEAEHVELPDGRLLAVVREEGPSAWGSDLCLAPADDLADWSRRRHDDRKFDSPHLFLHDGVPHLVARRQLAFGGRYDLGARGLGRSLVGRLPDGWRTKANMVAYALTPKRTAVFRIDVETLDAVWLGDLPSAGDTSFAASVPLPDGTGHRVFNYTSPPARGWWPWTVGQLRPTAIYAIDVHLD